MTDTLPWPSRAHDALRIWTYADRYGRCARVGRDGVVQRRWFHHAPGGRASFDSEVWTPGKRLNVDAVRGIATLIRAVGKASGGGLPLVGEFDQAFVQLADDPRAAHLLWESGNGVARVWGPGDETQNQALMTFVNGL